MKTRYTIVKQLILLCCAFTTTAVFGQTTYTWTGGNGTGTEIGAATNWGGTLPNDANGDTGQWNGTIAGTFFYATSTLASGFGLAGVNFNLGASQTGSVQIVSPVSSSANL